MPVTSNSLPAFTQQSAQLLSEAANRAAALPPNTVQVWPGGATFTSIQAAINSITNASPKVMYQVSVGAGTFTEYVTLQPYIYVSGAGEGNTIITSPGQEQAQSGVVNSAANAGISDLSIVATGGSWGVWPIGIKIVSDGPFHISDVAITSTDSNMGGNNVRGISNNTGSYTGAVTLVSSSIIVSGASDTTSIAVELFGNQGSNSMNLQVEFTAIEASGSAAYGVSTAVTASAILTDSKITAPVYALNNSDGISPITANQCSIDGPVSPGVTVNN